MCVCVCGVCIDAKQGTKRWVCKFDGCNKSFATTDAGVVVLSGTAAKYKLLPEIQSDKLREQLEDLLSESGQTHVVVVEETLDNASERVVAHVWMVTRNELMEVSAS